MGVPRGVPRGWKTELVSICERTSGEALSRNQLSSSALMATCSWVRAFPWKPPSRIRRQLRQAQFHCGKAPPAAVPSSFTCIWSDLELRADVGVDLAAELDLLKRRGSPFHNYLSSIRYCSLVPEIIGTSKPAGPTGKPCLSPGPS